MMLLATASAIVAMQSASFTLSPTQLAEVEMRSQLIRRKIEAAVPDDGDFLSTQRKRNLYLIHHQNELASKRADGYLSFPDYVCLQWAGMLLPTPPSSIIVSRQDFLDRFLGRPNEAGSGWKIPGDDKLFIALYDRIDLTHKGYISLSDYVREAALEFSSMRLDASGRIKL